MQFKGSLNRRERSNDSALELIYGETKKQALDKKLRPLIEFSLAPACSILAAYLLFLPLLRILGGLVYGLFLSSEMGG